MKGKNKATHFSKVVAVCPSQSAEGASGSAVKMLWTPHCLPAGGFWWEEGTSGLGHRGSASLQTAGGKNRNNGWRRLAEDLREKNPLFTATAWATSLGLLPHASGTEMGSMERPHTSRRPSQPKPEVSSPCYPSSSPPDAEQRD